MLVVINVKEKKIKKGKVKYMGISLKFLRG